MLQSPCAVLLRWSVRSRSVAVVEIDCFECRFGLLYGAGIPAHYKGVITWSNRRQQIEIYCRHAGQFAK